MIERPMRDVLINLRVTEEEREKLRAIAVASDETMAQTIRRFIRQRYEATFGDAPVGPRNGAQR